MFSFKRCLAFIFLPTISANDFFVSSTNIYSKTNHLKTVTSFYDSKITLFYADSSQINDMYYVLFSQFQSITIHLPSESNQKLFKYFTSASILQVFVAEGCSLQNLTEKNFNGATSLKTIRLKDNQINDIHKHAFTGLAQLENLYLASNRITSIRKETFDDLSALLRIWLDHNEIISIPFSLFDKNLKLKEVGLSCNKIFSIETKLEKLTPNIVNNIEEVFDEMVKNPCLLKAVRNVQNKLYLSKDDQKLPNNLYNYEEKFEFLQDQLKTAIYLQTVLIFFTVLSVLVSFITLFCLISMKLKNNKNDILKNTPLQALTSFIQAQENQYEDLINDIKPIGTEALMYANVLKNKKQQVTDINPANEEVCNIVGENIYYEI